MEKSRLGMVPHPFNPRAHSRELQAKLHNRETLPQKKKKNKQTKKNKKQKKQKTKKQNNNKGKNKTNKNNNNTSWKVSYVSWKTDKLEQNKL
jgi:acyl-CoA synthetase (AMP-forming)/AMP-acid ligase II